MFELFSMGGPLFMGILTLILISMLSVSLINGLPVLRGEVEDTRGIFRKISYIKSLGLFAFVIGLLGQLIGLFSAFKAIEGAGDISPSLVAGGFKVSMISTLYGLIIYSLSILIWLGLSFLLNKKQ